VTRKQRRFAFVAGAFVILTGATLLVLNALSDTIVFFYGPSEALERNVPEGQRFRIGGLVEQGSVVRGEGETVSFRVTDTKAEVTVTYKGLLPDLFREGQGVVAQGAFDANRTFVATEVLARHDETYMPPEVAKMLKEKGEWRGPDLPGAPEGPVKKPYANEGS
jgi:cytochrome c-type biogenesis protein CcmE